jgi:RNA recognition motif. (a.k.a. RRM, RBD, or RNP domain)
MGKKRKAESLSVRDEEASYKPGDIASFLQSAPTLGSAIPLERRKIKDDWLRTKEEDDDDNDTDLDDDDDDNDSQISIDERLLLLRRLDDEKTGDDWMLAYMDSEDEKNELEGDPGLEDEEDYERKPKKATIDKDAEEKKKSRSKIDPERNSKKIESNRDKTSSGDKPAKKLSANDSTSLRAGPVSSKSIESFKPVLFDKSNQPQSSSTASASSVPSQAPLKDAAPKETKAAPLPKEERVKPVAFKTGSAERCLYLNNLPLSATEKQLKQLLSSKVSKVHFEVNNNGTRAPIAYVELSSKSEVDRVLERARSSPLRLNERDLKVLPYSDALNYRRPDGSRRREKKKTGKHEADPTSE